MDGTFTDYGGLQYPMVDQEVNQELAAKLKECKTEEEKDEVIQEYVSMRIFALLGAIVVVLVFVAIIGGIIYFVFK